MPELIDEQSGRTPRYRCHDMSSIDVLIETDGDDARPIPADLLDISLNGARLCVPESLGDGQEVRLRLRTTEGALDLPVCATVQWSRGADSGMWVVGCSFADMLGDSTIQELVALGCLEESDMERRPVSVEASAWKELQPSAISVQMMDLAPGGVSLLCPETATVGQRLRLVPATAAGETQEVIVQVRSCAEVAEGFFLGCKFQDERSYQALRGAIGNSGAVPQLNPALTNLFRQSRVISRTTILLLGGILIGLAVRMPQPFYIMLLGLLSVLAYLALELVEQTRLRRQHRRGKTMLGELLEQRLEKRFIDLQRGWAANRMRDVNVTAAPLAAGSLEDGEFEETEPEESPVEVAV